MSSAGTASSNEFQLPRRVVRKLLRRPWFRRARSVLIVANGCTDIVHRLHRSGVKAAGIDDDSGNQTAEPLVHFSSVAGGFPFPPHAFDLVLVGRCRAFENGLNGPEPLIAMANLLSALKTRSRLVWLRTTSDSHPDEDDLTDGLPNFAGEITSCAYEDGWERFFSLEWLIGRHRDIELDLTTLTVPRKPVSRLAWHQLARDAALAQVRSRAA